MTTTLRGVIKDGKIEPIEPLDLMDGIEVVITVSEHQSNPIAGKRFLPGMFSHWPEVTEEDIKKAEFGGSHRIAEMEG